MRNGGGGGGDELRALLFELYEVSEFTSYEALAEAAHCGRGTVSNYLTKPAWRRDPGTVAALLKALEAGEEHKARARRLLGLDDGGATSTEAGYNARARVAACAVWPLAAFTASDATVHTAIGRRLGSA